MTDAPDSPHLHKLQAIGLLTGGVAHDLNNILAIIEGYAFILDHHLGSDPLVHDKLVAILAATARGTELTRAMLEFGQKRIIPQPPCDIVALIQECQPLLRSLLSSRIELTLQLPPAPLVLKATKDEILQVLIHQCHQIRQDITGTGRVLLYLTVGQEDVGLVLTNQKSGQEICYHLSRFIHAADLQDKTVLIVDDEEALLPVLEYQLRNMGLKVLKAANADSALLLQKDYPDVIDFLLTDIVMPDVDGVQLAEMMTDNRPRMRVVYMTGHTSRGAGINVPEDSPVVPKPLRPETLSLAFQKALEQVQDA